MSTKSTQWTSKSLSDGKMILLYSGAQQVVLQVRSQAVTEEDMLSPSFRVAVSLTPAETVALALDLLRVASPHLDQMQVDRTPQMQKEEQRAGWQI